MHLIRDGFDVLTSIDSCAEQLAKATGNIKENIQTDIDLQASETVTSASGSKKKNKESCHLKDEDQRRSNI